MDTGGQRPKTLLVTSAVPNEGKSTVAANLARTLAMGGASVVLIDGDLRKGVLHQLMGKTSHPGLTELLKSGGDVSQFLTPVSLNGVSVDQSIGVSENAERSAQGASRSASAPQASSQNAERSAPCASRPAPSENSPLPAPCSQLFLLPRGTRSISSGELFLTQAFDQLLAKLREQFDYVIIDSSPVFAADDAATLAPRVDGTVFVVRNSVSRARAVREALELLYQRQARVLGLIFNAANTASSSYYYYKYADYYPEPESKSEPRPEEPVGS
jgi:Mrp family chromosome partitioning ATPase